MRRATLLRSVGRLLGEEVREAAFMWSRHRWMIPYALVAGAAVSVTSAWAGFTEVATRVALGFAAGAVAVNATTEYRVLALTSKGLVLLRGSRIRQYATQVVARLPSTTTIAPVGGTVLASDWQVGDSVYTVPKSSERAIEVIARR